MIYRTTGMTKMPSNCLDCKECMCWLPYTKGLKDRILKPYLNKRHPNCPLIEIKNESEVG